ncbi:hypothetical protein A3D85_02855 [Candidatus Amesbacteria bacterium RIFCSPHIGHO2_02_FULL_47_9]|uniref:HIT domain-containing protein n=1 Tax=Candidatus Amesbacteria bacterium RIFCSPHIGHO2_01_FULL_48_32b TaxID=1797253 RepID=A0A1F4YGX4_9BACT|nr:MAG: hypothetical protein A2876_04875 [Candidatus Amesbacteria bacterium RIFCSPHIGHO2_01_FULL_48_32b]OGD03559.1 MAG: hypothetical protein A3D85_02855 [Candidatus Amesbacteria bacterium RIFCSPHIGHO2_02_FULL_47_9]OGD07029.1 MAG: hypothetical protein A2899_00130 [Candidatus Amesbacteria bacterium RIFCSPLOWO2_01_FULL_49_25]
MESCVFCKIAAGSLPAEKVYEDDEMIVIPDKNPAAAIHLLFISKSHGEEFHSVDPGKLARMLGKVREKIAELKMAYRVAMNGMGATLVSNHLHIHLLEKVSADRPV